jgi:hypothetical protein
VSCAVLYLETFPARFDLDHISGFAIKLAEKTPQAVKTNIDSTFTNRATNCNPLD